MNPKRVQHAIVERTPIAPDVEPPPRRPGVTVEIKVQLRMSAIQREHELPKVWPDPEGKVPLAALEQKNRLNVHPGIDEAILSLQDGTSEIIVATASLRARFNKNESKAYFLAEINADEMEIGDRLEGRTW